MHGDDFFSVQRKSIPTINNCNIFRRSSVGAAYLLAAKVNDRGHERNLNPFVIIYPSVGGEPNAHDFDRHCLGLPKICVPSNPKDMMQFKIPLSYSAIETGELIPILQQFEGQPHEAIIEAFEKKLCEVTGSSFAVALNSGTSAIHLALRVLGVTAGEYVPVSTFTYIGSVSPILYQNAEPIFIDCEAETWNLDPTLLETCLHELSKSGKMPKAIIVVHSYGMPAKMNEINAICKKCGVAVIEDAAEALGATYFGKPAGMLGDVGVLSFNSNKTITAFGGGAILTSSKSVYERIKFLAAHARESKPYYEHHELGFNYRMSPLNAAYGLSQLPHRAEKVKQRRSIHEQYKAHLQPKGFGFLDEPAGFYSSRWLTTVTLKPDINPLEIQAKLAQEGIETRPLWNPMHCQPAYSKLGAYKTGVADNLFASGLCLPSGGLESITISEICKQVTR